MDRYSRQTLFKPLGKEGQKKLGRKSVIIVGCGALGSATANTLARAGVGHLKIIDRDFVDESNLQRQMLFDEDDIANNLPKAIAAQKKLKKINSTIEIDAVVSDLNFTNVDELLKGTDVVIDGLDNFETRFLINDFCIKKKISWIYGACVGSMGLSMNIVPDVTPCIRCVFETQPPHGSSPTCDTSGIIAPIANIIASIQTTEALKILTDNLGVLNKHLISIDVWKNKYTYINIENAKDATDCPVCKNGKFEFLTAKTGSSTTTLCGRNAVQIRYNNVKNVNFNEIGKRLARIGKVEFNDFLMKFKIDGYDISLFNDGRAIILGTNDPVLAKKLYTKYIGM